MGNPRPGKKAQGTSLLTNWFVYKLYEASSFKVSMWPEEYCNSLCYNLAKFQEHIM